ncbi:ABC transporter substrate-binding protein [Propionimicrobium sp. PCR01-08-3]|uniref:ABC transporter substrate-binding protein n=1 Tax=Propionimicrobium sp. PCR01-08-3 TaxID=3052086 RepID=UPI00255C558C|nr:ABC transporter substrate-binding protein [Propionimicrobium sp. PCR01-08-3]WIY81567.1 ABC transporter substrate-binding protein [Propionimicrobium sp. PCR01-08-3]
MFRTSSARSPLAAAGALLLTVALAACGAPTDATSASGSSDAAGGFPVTVTSGTSDSTTTVTIDSQPEAIVSLSPTATESLFAIGAGEQVVAVDDQSNYPEEAPVTDLSGYQPNVEAILNYSPDLVVTSSDDPDTTASLENAGVPTLVLPSATNLDEAYDEIDRLGQATGNDEAADSLVEDMRSKIEAAVAAAPDVTDATYFHELDPTLFTVSSNTFLGEIYGLFGLQSIADASDGDDYPQLSEEYVVQANPDAIFLADAQCCGVTADQVAGRAGWSEVSAVQDDHVFVVDADIASRWGPRIVDYVEAVGEYVAELNPDKA